ncbi:MAG: tilS [Sphingobacteriaceae bacterium]|jgi:tRNA(Ile)-lysidine synthase|nr:tilS [Sphingobacteriaceae bacterium]
MLPLQRFKAFISEQNLIGEGDSVLLAVSGGKDSVLLAHLFNEAQLSFGIAHCNFGLRGEESDGDEFFVQELTKRLGVRFHSTRFDTESYAAERKISIQMAARELRYSWFETIRSEFGYGAIALAHHQNDVIETVLLNLTRGTGISGLHGILPKRDKLIRPMLFLSREEVDEIVESESVAYREDSSNSSSKYARNKLRNEVIPKLKELNPQLEQTFEANSKRFLEVERFLDTEVSALREGLFRAQPDGSYRIAVEELSKLEPQDLLMYELFKPFGFIEQVLADVSSSYGKHAGRIFESATHQLLLDRGEFILSTKNGSAPDETQIDQDQQSFSWNGINFVQNHSSPERVNLGQSSPAEAILDAESLVYPLTMRQWQQGDSFFPLGMKGRKKLSDFFVGLKIPLSHKSSVPVLVNGNGEIIWLAGYRIDERYKIGPQTKKVTIFGINNGT